MLNEIVDIVDIGLLFDRQFYCELGRGFYQSVLLGNECVVSERNPGSHFRVVSELIVSLELRLAVGFFSS